MKQTIRKIKPNQGSCAATSASFTSREQDAAQTTPNRHYFLPSLAIGASLEYATILGIFKIIRFLSQSEDILRYLPM